MWSVIRHALLIFLALTVVTGIAYPVVITGLAQIVFPYQANGSLIERDGKVIGSELIGQQFDDPRYFWSRPSATTPAYNASASTGSNLGPTNPAQLDAVRSLAAKLRNAHPDQNGPVPVDLVTASGSGLDPHISPAAAVYQIGRVAQARGLKQETLRELVWQHTEGRQFGVLGEPRVSVLELNLAMQDSHEN
jgi:K+-transporting ATPase ATPase C chain